MNKAATIINKRMPDKIITLDNDCIFFLVGGVDELCVFKLILLDGA